MPYLNGMAAFVMLRVYNLILKIQNCINFYRPKIYVNINFLLRWIKQTYLGFLIVVLN